VQPGPMAMANGLPTGTKPALATGSGNTPEPAGWGWRTARSRMITPLGGDPPGAAATLMAELAGSSQNSHDPAGTEADSPVPGSTPVPSQPTPWSCTGRVTRIPGWARR